MKLAFIIYRKWAFEIFKRINNSCNSYILITTKEHEFSITEAKKYAAVYLVNGNDNEKIYQLLKKNKIDTALFYGWSWIVNSKLLDNFLCLCLHPSPLPKYRGGTPIQHQILNKEKKSAVSVFKMGNGIDDGDIYMQLPMSLSGDINDIFNRMTSLGVKITMKFRKEYEKNKVVFTPQKNLSKYPAFKRRKPVDSEIKAEKLKDITFEDFNNLVRGLLDPFPNAYFIYKGKKVSILKVKKVKNIKSNANIANFKGDFLLKLKDSFARIIDYKTSNL